MYARRLFPALLVLTHFFITQSTVASDGYVRKEKGTFYLLTW
jgi:hypothetical protein